MKQNNYKTKNFFFLSKFSVNVCYTVYIALVPKKGNKREITKVQLSLYPIFKRNTSQTSLFLIIAVN